MKISEVLAIPPEAFHAFSVVAVRQDNSESSSSARYELACGKCGGGSFRLEALLSGEYGVAGVEVTCGECGEAGIVFHASRHGYDGRLGHLRFLRETTGRQPLCDEHERPLNDVQLACEVSYSTEPEELESIAAAQGIPVQDLFDGFAILTRSSATDAWNHVWEYECA